MRTYQPYNLHRYATSSDPLEISFSVDSGCSVTYLEHVVVQTTLSLTVNSGNLYSYNDYFNDPGVVYHSGARRGDISVEMYSPHETRSAVKGGAICSVMFCPLSAHLCTCMHNN